MRRVQVDVRLMIELGNDRFLALVRHKAQLGVSHLLIRTGITKRQQQYAALRQSARHLDRCGAHGPIVLERANTSPVGREQKDRKSTTSELQSLMRISYAVFCLKKKT